MAILEYPQKSFINYSIFFPSLSKVISSDSFMDLNIHVYLEDFQEAIVPLVVKINLFMDFKILVLDIQLTSLYPLNIAGYLI